jgi:hypothetical protein
LVAKFRFGPSYAQAVTGWASALNDPYIASATATQNGITVMTLGTGNNQYWNHDLGINVYNGGKTTGNNSGIVPDSILKYFVFNYGADTALNAQIQITGLTPNASYVFKIGASYSTTDPNWSYQFTGTIDYRYDNMEFTLDNTDNTIREATMTVTADGTGKVIFKIATLSPNTADFRLASIGWIRILQVQ